MKYFGRKWFNILIVSIFVGLLSWSEALNVDFDDSFLLIMNKIFLGVNYFLRPEQTQSALNPEFDQNNWLCYIP